MFIIGAGGRSGGGGLPESINYSGHSIGLHRFNAVPMKAGAVPGVVVGLREAAPTAATAATSGDIEHAAGDAVHTTASIDVQVEVSAVSALVGGNDEAGPTAAIYWLYL